MGLGDATSPAMQSNQLNNSSDFVWNVVVTSLGSNSKEGLDDFMKKRLSDCGQSLFLGKAVYFSTGEEEGSRTRRPESVKSDFRYRERRGCSRLKSDLTDSGRPASLKQPSF